MSTETPGTSLAVRTQQPRAISAAYEPRDFSQAMTMAATLGKAAGLQPEEAYLKMAAGDAYGIPAVTSLRWFDIIPGPGGTKQVAPRAQALVAMCLTAPQVCEYFRRVSSDATQATWECKRRGNEPQVVRYTVEDAKRAGLIKSGGAWEKDPESQCNARASARLARIEFSDVCGGMVSSEERDDFDDRPEPVSPLPTTPRQAPLETLEGELVADSDGVVTEKVSDGAPAPLQPPGDIEKFVLSFNDCRHESDRVAVRAEAVKKWGKDIPPLVMAASKAAAERIKAGGAA